MNMNRLYETALYETIFKRKSIRKYQLTPLDDSTLLDFTKHIEGLVPLYPNIVTEIKVVSSSDVKGYFQAKAPYFLAAFSEVKDGYLTDMGFMLQQMDLFFSANGIGSCWQGVLKPTGELRTNRNLEFVISLAFGSPGEKLHRESINEFKRKSLEQIRNTKGIDELMDPVRLAPSASNNQPWFFTGEDNLIHAYAVKPGFIKVDIMEKLHRVDMGIAICHLWIVTRHFGKKFEIVENPAARDNPPKGYYYIASLKI